MERAVEGKMLQKEQLWYITQAGFGLFLGYLAVHDTRAFAVLENVPYKNDRGALRWAFPSTARSMMV